MFVPLVALFIGGGAGLLITGRRGTIQFIAIATPLLAAAAFVSQVLPGGAQSCTGTIDGTTTCQAAAAISGWSGPLPYAIAAALVVLSLAPLLSFYTGSWVPAAAAAVLQTVPQVISWGFSDWAPALVATVAVAAALALRPRVAGAHSGGAHT